MIDETVKAMAREPNFATLTTLSADGHPTTQVMWVDADDEHLLINTEPHRHKFRNMQRDPRVTVTILDRDNPYRYAEVRGRVVSTETGPEARAHIDALSQKYGGNDYPDAAITSERVIVRIVPERQLVNG